MCVIFRVTLGTDSREIEVVYRNIFGVCLEWGVPLIANASISALGISPKLLLITEKCRTEERRLRRGRRRRKFKVRIEKTGLVSRFIVFWEFYRALSDL